MLLPSLTLLTLAYRLSRSLAWFCIIGGGIPPLALPTAMQPSSLHHEVTLQRIWVGSLYRAGQMELAKVKAAFHCCWIRASFAALKSHNFLSSLRDQACSCCDTLDGLALAFDKRCSVASHKACDFSTTDGGIQLFRRAFWSSVVVCGLAACTSSHFVYI